MHTGLPVELRTDNNRRTKSQTGIALNVSHGCTSELIGRRTKSKFWLCQRVLSIGVQPIFARTLPTFCMQTSDMIMFRKYSCRTACTLPCDAANDYGIITFSRFPPLFLSLHSHSSFQHSQICIICAAIDYMHRAQIHIYIFTFIADVHVPFAKHSTELSRKKKRNWNERIAKLNPFVAPSTATNGNSTKRCSSDSSLSPGERGKWRKIDKMSLRVRTWTLKTLQMNFLGWRFQFLGHVNHLLTQIKWFRFRPEAKQIAGNQFQPTHAHRAQNHWWWAHDRCT